MKITYVASLFTVLACLPMAEAGEKAVKALFKAGPGGSVTYQALPMEEPKGGDDFRGSDFIHPLKTPSGFVVTDLQPSDHLHHFGLWWPWKYLVVDGRKVLCWELQKGEGLIEARGATPTKNGFTAHSVYIDRKVPGGPVELLKETVVANISEILEQPTRGYFLDLDIMHEVAVDEPVTVLKYRYSGFALRGSPLWNKENSTLLTSEGKHRDDSNTSRGKWVRVEGDAGEGRKAGILLMSNPGNFDHPERLRTWDSKMHKGAVFVNFNSVQERSWVMEPGKSYTRKYRVFVYDGTLSADQAEALWKQYK